MTEQEPADELEANERGVEVEPPLMTIQNEEEEEKEQEQQQEDVSTKNEKKKKEEEVKVDDDDDLVEGSGPPPSVRRLQSAKSEGMESSILKFRNINFIVGNKKDYTRNILTDVSGIVKFGRVLASTFSSVCVCGRMVW